ncbi:MAG TPA: hypothetical protein VJZ71_02960 [Phycisphaerae bacterium]|nr:hypothetical protein [Phycisphaerae bacterium]
MPPPTATARLLIKMTRDNITADRSARPIAVAGILVGAIALLGVDLISSSGPARSHKSPASVVHSVATASSAAIGIPTALAGSAAVLALVLWLGRHGADLLRQLVPIESQISHVPAKRSPAPQSRQSISYHTGGLYGP